MSKGQPLGKMKSKNPPNPPQTMEESTIILPVIMDGVIGLGDLWDCNSSTCPGNLFGEQFAKEDLEAFPIQSLEYTMYRSKNTLDRINSMKVSASVALEMAKIKIAGSAKFENVESKKFNEEELICRYQTSTFVVRFRQSSARLIDPIMRQRIKAGTCRATHVVQAVRIGGDATASIRVHKNIDDTNLTIGGSFDGELMLGKITVTVKLELEMIDKEKKEDFTIDVSVDARPRFEETPTNVAKMFKAIESLDTRVNAEKHFPLLGPQIVGVPISFKLVPLDYIMTDYEPKGLFKLMEDNILNSFSSMVFTCQDYQLPNFIKGLLREREPRLVIILRDEANPFTLKVSELEAECEKKAKEISAEAYSVYAEYKNGNKEIEDIQAVVSRYDKEFNVTCLISKILGMVQEGKQELNGVHASDAVNLKAADKQPVVKFFTNELDLAEWWNAERNVKVLLQTDSSQVSPSGTFLHLFELSSSLAKHNIEVGIAFPNVSKDFSLTIKIQDKSAIYFKEDIPFALKVLAICIDGGELMATLYYRLMAVLSGLNLNSIPDNIPDLISLVSIFKDSRDITICESYPQLVAELMSTTGVWNFVLPLQAVHTCLESMTFFRQLREILPDKYPCVKHRWIVGSFNVSNVPNAPLLLVFKDERLEGICLDHLDILILLHQFTSSARNPDLTLLSHSSMKQGFYPDRANFTLKILSGFVLEHSTDLTTPQEPIQEFPTLESLDLSKALELTAACAIRDETLVLNTVFRLAIQDLAELSYLLVRFGWADEGFPLVNETSADWKALLKDLKTFLGNQAPYLIKVEGSIESIRGLKPPEDDGDEETPLPEDTRRKQLTEILKFVTDFSENENGSSYSIKWAVYSLRGQPVDEELKFANLKKEIDGFRTIPEIEIVVRGVLNALERFYNEEVNSSQEFFNLIQGTRLVESMTSADKSLKPIMIDVVGKYCGRIEIPSQPGTTLEPEAYDLTKVWEALGEGNLFKAVRLLANLAQHPTLYRLTGELFNLGSLLSAEPIKQILESMPKPDKEDEVQRAQCKRIWTNPKFAFLMVEAARGNEAVVETIFLEFCEKYGSVPSYFPKEIEHRLLPYFHPVDDVRFEWAKEWGSFEDVIQLFQILVTRKEIPSAFNLVLRQHLEGNDELLKSFQDARALFYWDEVLQYFKHPWGVDTITCALDRLMDLHRIPKFGNAVEKLMQVKIQPKVLEPLRTYEVIDIWRKFTQDGQLGRARDEVLGTITSLNPIPTLAYDELDKTLAEIIPNLIRLSRMHNTTGIQPAQTKGFINYPPTDGIPRPGHIDFEAKAPKIAEHKFLFSKGDLLTAIFNAADSLVIHHILRGLLKNSYSALPLLVPGMIAEKDAYKFLLPALQPLIAPELVGLLSQPHLLTKPFRLVTCIRVGEAKGKLGKSSIINQLLMSHPNFFSCFAEPGAENGKPIARAGLVEFTWMSRRTINQDFYEAVVQEYYASAEPHMLLLANLHGDALSLEPLLHLLKNFTSSFIVFWKASSWNELKGKKAELSRLIGSGSNVLDLVIHPDQTIANKVGEQNVIVVGNPEETRVSRIKLQEAFREAFSRKLKSPEVDNESSTENLEVSLSGQMLPGLDFITQCKSARYQVLKGEMASMSHFRIAELEDGTAIACEESYALLDFFQKLTIPKVKQILISPGIEDENHLVTLSQLVLAILALTPGKRNGALSHVIYELDHMSSQSSAKSVERVLKLRRELENTSPNLDAESLAELQDEVKSVIGRQEVSSLSMNDIFRFIMKETQEQKLEEPVLTKYAELFNAGFPIELFQPTYGEVMWSTPVRACIGSLPLDTRVFVLSIVGLKAAGKSTVLNRLFGHAFTEGAAGCTKGLQMRLLWIADPALKKKLNCDVFLLIDAEGFGAPENMVDDQADLNERSIATFILGISHLVLVNVLGEGMKEMKDILEIGFMTQTRMLTVPIMPDIILLHQQLEAQASTLSVQEEWGNLLENVKSLTREQEAGVGVRVKAVYRMEAAIQAHRHGDLVHTIRPLSTNEERNFLEYHADLQALFRKIMSSCENSSQIQGVGEWYKSAAPYWTAINDLPLPNYYYNCAQIQSSVNMEARAGGVKLAIDSAFRKHDVDINIQFEEKVRDVFDLESDYAITTDYDSEARNILNNFVVFSLKKVINACDSEVGGGPCSACQSAFTLRETLLREQRRGFLTVDSVTNYSNMVWESLRAKYKQRIAAVKIQTGKSEEMKEFHKVCMEGGEEVAWVKFLQYTSTFQTVRQASHYIEAEAASVYSVVPHVLARISDEHAFPDLESILAYDLGHYNKALESSLNAPKRETLTWERHDWLIAKINDIPSVILSDNGVDYYLVGMVRELRDKMREVLAEFALICEATIHPNFKWEAELYALKTLKKFFAGKQEEWDKGNNPVQQLFARQEEFKELFE